MTVVVLAVLVALWLAVLVPPTLRYLVGERRRADSVDDFNDVLTVLGRTNGHHGQTSGGTAPVMSVAQRRRRDVLLTLGGVAAGSLILAVGVGGRLLWGLALVAVSLLGGYVYLLVQHRQRVLERRQKVRYLPSQSMQARQYPPARVASGR